MNSHFLSLRCFSLFFNPFTPKSDLTDFTLSNARRFYSSKGDTSGVKGLKEHLETSSQNVKFIVCNPCQPSRSLTILGPLKFIIISSVFFYISKLLYSGFLQFKCNRPLIFRVLLCMCLCFKTSLSAKPFMQFHFHANQSHFHKNDFALRLALKQRYKGTSK